MSKNADVDLHRIRSLSLSLSLSLSQRRYLSRLSSRDGLALELALHALERREALLQRRARIVESCERGH